MRWPLFYGWWIVITGTLVSALVGGSVFYGLGAFFAPIQRSFGLSYAAVSVAFTVQSLVMGTVTPLVGWLFDRVGPRRLVLAGVAFAGFGFLVLSRSTTTLQLYVAFGLIGLGASASTSMLFNSVVTLWFERNLGRALFLVQAGYGAGGLIAAAFLFLIVTFGWRAAATAGGVVILAICLPVGAVLRHRPEDLGLRLDGGLLTSPFFQESNPVAGQASSVTHVPSPVPVPNLTISDVTHMSAFWVIGLVLMLSMAAMTTVFVHEIPALITFRVPTKAIGVVVAATLVVGLVGRWGLGWLASGMSSRYLFALALALQAGGILSFSSIKADALIPTLSFICLFGIGQGGIFVLLPIIQKDYFGRRNFATIHGMLMGASIVGSALAPTIAGSAVDALGSYRPVFSIVGVLNMMLIPLVILTGHRSSRPAPSVSQCRAR